MPWLRCAATMMFLSQWQDNCSEQAKASFRSAVHKETQSHIGPYQCNTHTCTLGLILVDHTHTHQNVGGVWWGNCRWDCRGTDRRSNGSAVAKIKQPCVPVCSWFPLFKYSYPIGQVSSKKNPPIRMKERKIKTGAQRLLDRFLPFLMGVKALKWQRGEFIQVHSSIITW